MTKSEPAEDARELELEKAGRVLYITSVDISIGNGCGVNEREFTLALYKKLQGRAHFIIPRPKNDNLELPKEVCSFSSPHKRHNPFFFPAHVWSTIRAATQILKQRDFDLIVFRLGLLPIAPLYITRKAGIPYAIKTLGQGLMKTFEEKLIWPLGSLVAKLNGWVVRQLVKGAASVDTVSPIQLKFLEDALGPDSGKIICLDNAVNTDRFFPTSSSDARKKLGLDQFDPIIGFIGNHAAQERGVTQLISSIPTLLKKFPKLGVFILGQTGADKRLLNLAKELGVTDHCVFTGQVPFEHVPDYANALDVGVSFLSPRFSGQSELKVRQQLACGKPVVATTPGSNDFLADAQLGSLVQYDNMAGICSELERWLSLTKDERAQFSARASHYAREHLSMEDSLRHRLEIWSRQIAQQAEGTGR